MTHRDIHTNGQPTIGGPKPEEIAPHGSTKDVHQRDVANRYRARQQRRKAAMLHAFVDLHTDCTRHHAGWLLRMCTRRCWNAAKTKLTAIVIGQRRPRPRRLRQAISGADESPGRRYAGTCYWAAIWIVLPASPRFQTAPVRIALTRLGAVPGSTRERVRLGVGCRAASVEEIIGEEVGGVRDADLVGGGVQNGAITERVDQGAGAR